MPEMPIRLFCDFCGSELEVEWSQFKVKPCPICLEGRSAPSITDRAIVELRNGKTLDTWSLIRAMQASGFTSTAKDIYLTVYGSLNRAAKRPNSRIVKIGAKWGSRTAPRPYVPSKI